MRDFSSVEAEAVLSTGAAPVELQGDLENDTAYVEVGLAGVPVRWVIDTGATHDLLITRAEQARIGLRFDDTSVIDVADFRGGSRSVPFTIVEIDWLGRRRAVQVIFDPDAAEPLLELGLLRDSCLCLDGSRVAVRPVAR